MPVIIRNILVAGMFLGIYIFSHCSRARIAVGETGNAS